MQTTSTLGDVRRFADELGPAATALQPTFRALDRTNRVVTPIAREITPVLRDQIRPFVREARPLVSDLRPAASGLAKSLPDVTGSFVRLNHLFNMLGYNPNGAEAKDVANRQEGYLFWLAWLTHQTENLINVDDANGPMRPVFLTGTCQTITNLVNEEPQLEFLLGLSGVLADTCNNPATTSLNLPVVKQQLRKDARAVEGRRDEVKTSGATRGQMAAMVIFAFSCFSLLLFLWLSFGGSIPLKPKGYRFMVSFPEATTLADEADVRVAGVSVGQVKDIVRDPAGNRTLATVEMDRAYAPVNKDAKAILRQKTLLGETYVEMTLGHAKAGKIAEDGRLSNARVEPAVELDEVLELFPPKTRADFRRWQANSAASIKGRGQDLNSALGNIAGFSDERRRPARRCSTATPPPCSPSCAARATCSRR